MSFFNNIGNLFTNPGNTINNSINWFDNTGVGGFLQIHLIVLQIY